MSAVLRCAEVPAMTAMDPTELVTAARAGLRFTASRRTWAHLDATIAHLAQQHPTARLEIIQGCYHDGALSAGTHDYDAVLDVRIVGMGWWDAQWFLRTEGWAAWYRHTGTWASEYRWHIHMVSLGYATRVGVFVPAQVVDYFHHALGLKGQHNSGADTSPFPRDISATIFDFALWERELDDAMPFSDWPQADQDAMVNAVAAAVVATVVDGDHLTLGQGVHQASNAPGLVRQLATKLKIKLPKEN